MRYLELFIVYGGFAYEQLCGRWRLWKSRPYLGALTLFDTSKDENTNSVNAYNK